MQPARALTALVLFIATWACAQETVAPALPAPVLVPLPAAAPAEPDPAAATGVPTTPPAAAAVPEGSPPMEVRRALAVDAPVALPPPAKLVYTHCQVPAPVIAFTFDDGPHPELTPKLLDILKERGLKATFFMVGRNVTAYPQIVRRMVEEGHEVANHSWSHPLLTSLGDTSLDSQLRRTHDAIIKACGVTPTLYRPPYGQTRLSQRKKIKETFGYTSILWDVDPQDWQSPRTAKKVHDRVLAQTKSGSIILCHDIHATTIEAMPAVFDELKARGYQFATVSQLLELEAMTAATAAAAPAKEEVLPSIPVTDQTPAPGSNAAPAPASPGSAPVSPAPQQAP